MTIIAYRAGILAADTLFTGDRGLKSYGTKVFQLSDGRICGFAGNPTNFYLFKRFLENEGDRPTFAEKDRERFHALVLSPDGKLEEWEDERISVPIEDEFYAIGSGAVAATAAMHMGADARRAVEIAILCDEGCGGSVKAISIREAPS